MITRLHRIYSWIADKRDYLGLLLVALATIMYELLLTRIFSALLFYHLAFMAISIAMLGMTMGAIVVYVIPAFRPLDNAGRRLSTCSLLFAIGIVCSFALMNSAQRTLSPVQSIVFLMMALFSTTIPFTFSGMAICQALTKLRRPIGSLYAADLIGAAAGCVLLVVLLEWVDAPSVMFIVAGLAGLAAVFFCMAENRSLKQLLNVAITLGLLIFAVTNSILASHNQALVKLHSSVYQRGGALADKWNCFSRVEVVGDPNDLHVPDAWGLSSTWPRSRKVSELTMAIDSHALTTMTRFDGHPNTVEHLKYDLTNLVHYIRSNANVLVVGVGAGRDVLSAIIFGDREITGVEINGNILKLLTGKFGDYTGHLNRYPQVRLVNDEARSYITRSPEKYDVIQISLIDTSAATAAGAYVFTEHSVYTKEAWKIFLDHLTPQGVLSVSRWYAPEHPLEVYRLICLATAALRADGITNVRDHIIVMSNMHGGGAGRYSDGIATMLMCKSGFSKQDLEKLQSFASEKHFTLLMGPTSATDPYFEKLASTDNGQPAYATFPLDISPPTDDRPFYLFFYRLQDVVHPENLKYEGQFPSFLAITVLKQLLAVITGLIVLGVFLPLAFTKPKVNWKKAVPLGVFFMNIGLAYMFIEISQMQRLIIFLGHPIYGLSVVLFTLLLASGIGSYSTTRLAKADNAGSKRTRLILLLALLVAFGLITPPLIYAFQSAVLAIRILAAISILFPLGIFMGMAFPFGMTLAEETCAELTPWYWGINGAASVYASVLVMAVSLTCGVTVAFWMGFGLYAAAVGTYFLATRTA